MADDKTFRVIIWGVPRSISTCILKCLSFQPNTQAWMEPYCLSFFAGLGSRNMGFPLPRYVKDFNPQAMAAGMGDSLKGTKMEKMFSPDEIDVSLLIQDSVRMQLDALPAGKSHVIKDMAYAVTGGYEFLPSKESNFKHVFLIRRPDCMFPSWRNLLMKQMKNMGFLGNEEINEESFDMTSTKDVPFIMPGYTYKCQYDLWKHVKENIDPNPVVIDCDELALNPAELLPKLCEASGMPFDEQLLEWDGNPDTCGDWRCLYPMKKADGQLRGQHDMALHSTKFVDPKPPVPRSEMKPDVIKCVDATVEYYDEMALHRIKPSSVKK